jgi:hypothetical protein
VPGAVCGSSDLNERFQQFAALHISEQKQSLEALDLETTIDKIIECEMMPYFESDVKRAYDLTETEVFCFRIRGLRESTKNPRLKQNKFLLSPYVRNPLVS